MRQRYITVLMDDVPFSVVCTDSSEEAVAITAWLSGTSDLRKSKRRRGSGRSFRCRSASCNEAAVFQALNVDWVDAQLKAVLLSASTCESADQLVRTWATRSSGAFPLL